MQLQEQVTSKEFLVAYEMPWWCWFVSNNYLQEVIATWIANRVNRKYKKALKTLKYKNLLENNLLPTTTNEIPFTTENTKS